jgi:hypothetical protein
MLGPVIPPVGGGSVVLGAGAACCFKTSMLSDPFV